MKLATWMLLFVGCWRGIAHQALTAAIIYHGLDDTLVRAQIPSGGDPLPVSESFRFDLNQDGLNDLRMAHEFRPRSHRISSDDAAMIKTAIDAMYEAKGILNEVRGQALQAANEGVHTAQWYFRTNDMVQDHLDRMDELALTTQYDGRRLLNGDSGYQGVSSSAGIEFLAANHHTIPGVYDIEVITSAERATLLSTDVQNNPLGQDETIVINGVIIELYEDLESRSVADLINRYVESTGVTAAVVQNGVDAGKLRLSTQPFGKRASLIAISDQDTDTVADTTGIDVSTRTDTGEDLVVEINGVGFNGRGQYATALSGPMRGLAIRIAPDTGDNRFRTLSGDVGTVTVSDESLKLPLSPDAEEHLRVTLPNLRPQALGHDLGGNLFRALSDVNVLRSQNAQAALRTIDIASEEIAREIGLAEAPLEHNYRPFGRLTIQGEGSGEFLADGNGDAVRLTAGELIDPDAIYAREPTRVTESTFGGTETGYFGVRLMVGDEYHYGWILGTLGNDDALTAHGFAIESAPGQGIRAGAVPEPHSLWPLLTGLQALRLRYRCRRRQ